MRRATPSPSESSASRTKPDETANSTKPPGVPDSLRVTRPKRRGQVRNVFERAPRALQKPALVPSGTSKPDIRRRRFVAAIHLLALHPSWPIYLSPMETPPIFRNGPEASLARNQSRSTQTLTVVLCPSSNVERAQTYKAERCARHELNHITRRNARAGHCARASHVRHLSTTGASTGCRPARFTGIRGLAVNLALRDRRRGARHAPPKAWVFRAYFPSASVMTDTHDRWTTVSTGRSD